MRSDLDVLLQQRGLAGVVVLAHDRYCPAFYYATGQRIHHGLYVRAADGRAHLVHDPMERDQAAAVGCATSSYAQRGLLQKVKTAESQARGLAELVVELARELDLRGTLAFVGKKNEVAVWNIAARTVSKRIPIAAPARLIRCSPDGRSVAMARPDEGVDLMDPASGTVTATFRDCRMVLDLAWDPKGRRLAMATADGRIFVWDTSSEPSSARHWEAHADGVPRIAWHPDGRLLAVWFSGPFEASVHQVILGSFSSDGGKTWSKAETVQDFAHVSDFDPALLNVAFVFLLLGYGTKVGLAPLHAWLPDAHAEGPTPISAVLSGLLLNVALYAVQIGRAHV